MSPTRVGVIGLSQSSLSSWASVAHLPYINASEGKYEIKALCNSSVESAKKAIDAYNLPSLTKAYGDPQDLANDPEIDLVVCSTRVDKHYKTIKPSVEAGKNVFVEWPLGANVQQAEELTALANKKGVKTIIGLQGRQSPISLKVKDILKSGKIGKVLSSSITASSGSFPPESIPENLTFFYERSVGCNLLTIHFAHWTDSILNVLGPMKFIAPHLSLQRPNVNVLSPTGEVSRVMRSETPDLINVHGTLPSHNNAPISIIYRAGHAFKGTPALIWSIVGEKGEIRVEGEQANLHAVSTGFKILLQSKGSDEVETVEWRNEMAERGLQGPAQNTGSLYEAFATRKEGSWPGFEQALERHRMLEEVWGDWKA